MRLFPIFYLAIVTIGIGCSSKRDSKQIVPMNPSDTSIKPPETTGPDDNVVANLPIVITNVFIETAPLIKIDARIYEPIVELSGSKLPTIIFASSWAVDKSEYEIQAKAFAQEGYLVLSYTPRGFGKSGGLVSGAGTDDQKDISAIIDWMEANTRIDIKNLGMSGISYGGGLSLLGAARDARIKTVVVMSGWADLKESLYSENTLHKDWVKLLLLAGELTGQLDPTMNEQFDRVSAGKEIDEFSDWASERSVIRSIDALNKRNVPIFVMNSYEDALFSPNQMAKFYSSLTVPKKFYLDHGIHTSSQLPGLMGLTAEVWTEAHLWMRHWLVKPQLDVKFGILMSNNSGLEKYLSFPQLIADERMILSPRNKLISSAETSAEDAIQISAYKDSGASTRDLAIVSGILRSHFNFPVSKTIRNIEESCAAIYDSPRSLVPMKIRGSPQVEFTVDKHDESFTLVVYLYETDGNDLGKLITHGVLSELEPSTSAKTYKLDLGMIAYDLPVNAKFTLVFDSTDPLYLSRSSKTSWVRLLHNGKKSTHLSLPLVP